MSVISPEEQHSQSLTEHSVDRWSQFRTRWEDRVSGDVMRQPTVCLNCIFYCESFILSAVLSSFYPISAGNGNCSLSSRPQQVLTKVSDFFKTNFLQSRCWPVKPCLQSAGVQGSCLPAGLEHLSSHSSVPEFGAQFAYVAPSLWEYLPLNT